jgi:hypothetical protein
MSDYYYYYYYYPTALFGPWPLFQVLDPVHTVELLGICPSQNLHTEQQEHRINVHNTDVHVSSGIRAHDPSVRASEDSSCLSPLGHCDRQF